tara:strand:+ start:861 stop:1022 length:162 start_codon:yes stop_codon:yes gene_type:complete
MASRKKRIALFKQKILKEQLEFAFDLIKKHCAAKRIQDHLRKYCVLQRGFVVL